MTTAPAGEKARRRAARQEIVAYHEAALTELIGHLRIALARFEVGEVDAFEVDDVVHTTGRPIHGPSTAVTETSAGGATSSRGSMEDGARRS